jgi:glycerophosphoryl diester phosphodiesterase
VDVQRTSDGTLVLVHDDDWQRTTGRAASVAATPWADVRHFDAGSWFAAAYAGSPPGRLQDALEVLPPHSLLNLELKAPRRHPGLGADVLAALRAAPRRPRVLLTSFDHDCIDTLVGADPSVELGYLGTRALPVGGAVKTQALHYEAILAEPQVVRRIHAAGGRVLAWTVDDVSLAVQLASLGVDALISNDPGKLRPPEARS